MNVLDTIRKSGYTAKIVPDFDPSNPREEFDNASTIYYISRNYVLGDKRVDSGELTRIANDPNVLWIPVYAYIHGGVTISARRDDRNPYPDPEWDSGQSGIVAMTKEQIRENFGCKRVTKAIRERAYDLMVAEVEEYDQFLRGDVYGVIVEDAKGEEIDSCWGFYGFEYAKQEAERMIDEASS
jgi:hypothetical protein